MPKFMLFIFYSPSLSAIFSSGNIYIDCPILTMITPSNTIMLTFYFSFDFPADRGLAIDHFFTIW